MHQALLLVDVQNDYFEQGRMELVGMDPAAENCRRILQSFRQRQAPLFHIQHIANYPHAPFFSPDTEGVKTHNSVVPEQGEPLVIKHYPNAFRETALHSLLKNAQIEEVVICGAMSHMCIDTTTRAAFDLGYRCQVISDACATRDLVFNNRTIKAEDVHAAFMSALSAPFARVMTAGQFLSEQ
ncbi:MAG TPA: cysteine hydrolase [Gammaproteobacteria bacterium]|nr:cysteine hydrolase [Gammaproteobacteria bacterium]